MSFSKLSLLAAAATLAFSGLSAHADSLTLGNGGAAFSFFFNGDFQTAGGGNMTGSAVIGGNAVNFSAIYCVDLNDEITTNSTYNNTTFSTNGKVNGSTVHNDAAIAWLLLNINPTSTTQSEGLQAAIWEEEYGNDFSVFNSFGQSGIISAETADLNLLQNAINHNQVSSSLVDDVLWITPPTTTEGFGWDRETVDRQGLVGVVNDPPPAVPEPASLSLFGTGVLALAGLVRRRLSA